MFLCQNSPGWLAAPVAIVLAFGIAGMTSGQTVMSNMSGEDLALVMQTLNKLHPLAKQSQESTARSQEIVATGSRQEQTASERLGQYIEKVMKTYDRDGDGVLNKEESSSLRRLPLNVDANGDGTLTADEILAVYEAALPPEESSRSAAARTGLNTLSARSQASQQESGTTRSASNQASSDERMRNYAESLVKVYDENGDGLLDKNEMSKMRRQPSNADGNGDGFVGIDELVSALVAGGSPPVSSRSSSSVPTRVVVPPAESIGLAVLAVHVPDGNDTSVSELADTLRTADFGRLQSLALRLKSAGDRSVVYGVAESLVGNPVELNATCQMKVGEKNPAASYFQISLQPKRVGDQLQVGFSIRQSEQRSYGLGLSATAMPRPDSNSIYQLSEANGVWIIAVCARPVDTATPATRSRSRINDGAAPATRSRTNRDSQPRTRELPKEPDGDKSNERESDRAPERSRRGGGNGE